MKHTKKKIIQNFASGKLVIILVASIGLIYLISARASSYFVLLEVESGSTGGVATVNSQNASGGGYVQFDSHNSNNRMNLFISEAELTSVKSKYLAGQEPWKTAGNKVISNANSELGSSYYSVTKNGGGGDYFTEQPYTSDGVYNPNADRRDYLEAGKFGKAVRNLALAYHLTGNNDYADRAVYLLDKWMVDSSTKMIPKYTGGQSGIEISITMPAVFYGIDLLEPYTGWPVSNKQSVLSWVSSFSDNAASQNWSAQNNWQDWLNVAVASSAALIHDSGRLNSAIDKWKTRLDSHVSSDGLYVQEIGRTLSLDYSTFAMDAFTQVALISKHNGTNLFNYSSPSGKTLKSTFDKHAGYLINPSSWPHKQISSYKGSEVAVYEIAYQVYGEQSYKSVIDHWGRPMDDIWTLGITTLTHARDSY